MVNDKVSMKWGAADVKNQEHFSHYTHAITFKFEQFENNKQSRGDCTHLMSHTESNLKLQMKFYFLM